MSSENFKKYKIRNNQIKCSICDGELFHMDKAQLNTKGMTLLGLDGFNPSATTLFCKGCAQILWFRYPAPEEIESNN